MVSRYARCYHMRIVLNGLCFMVMSCYDICVQLLMSANLLFFFISFLVFLHTTYLLHIQ